MGNFAKCYMPKFNNQASRLHFYICRNHTGSFSNLYRRSGLLPCINSLLDRESFSVFLNKNAVLIWIMGKWKCLWCSKVLEGESFMDLIEASAKEEAGQHVHGWENITLIEEESKLANKLLTSIRF